MLCDEPDNITEVFVRLVCQIGCIERPLSFKRNLSDIDIGQFYKATSEVTIRIIIRVSSIRPLNYWSQTLFSVYSLYILLKAFYQDWK